MSRNQKVHLASLNSVSLATPLPLVKPACMMCPYFQSPLTAFLFLCLVFQTSPAKENNNNTYETTREVDENVAKSSGSMNPKKEENKETSSLIRSESTAVTAEVSSSPLPAMPSKEASNCDDVDCSTQWSAIVDRDIDLQKQPAADEPTTPVAASGSRKCSLPVAASASPEAGVQHCRDNAAHASDQDDLDAAVQKLESMRLGDKQLPKRKSNPSKRHSTAKDAAVAAAAAAAEAECSKGGPPSAGKSKLPSSISSQLTSPSSKIKKRKSRKKSKGGSGVGSSVPGDEIVHNCKSSSSETTPAAVSNACDARNGFDPCDRTSPSTKSAFRMCLPESEKLLRCSTENDSLR